MSKKNKSNQKYRYCGAGAGIAGLPHEVNDAEAEKRGVTKILSAALKAGAYIKIPSEPEEESGEEILDQKEIDNG